MRKKVEDLSTKVEGNNNNGKTVEWQSQVLELTSRGNSEAEIARILHVDEATVSGDYNSLGNKLKIIKDSHSTKSARRISALYNWIKPDANISQS
jgi:DNA-binding NarL/FixJ family response regulator